VRITGLVENTSLRSGCVLYLLCEHNDEIIEVMDLLIIIIIIIIIIKE
jgi:hypothetical protein